MSTPVRTQINRVIVVLGGALIIATGVVFVAHDDARSTRATARPAVESSAAVTKVPIRDFLYKPEAITVTAGTKVTFTNEDAAPHTATSGPAPAADGVFDTGTLKKGQSKAVKLAKAGTFAYYCAIHPFMKATVTVK